MKDKKHCEWFTNWFDTPYYHILYKSRGEKEAQDFIDNLLNELNLPAGARIADIACGRGRHAVYLNKKGFEVTGIDVAPESIKYAKQFENSALHFSVHDMRQPFATNQYDVALNLFTSLGYFKTEQEDEQAIHAIYLALKKDGILVIDFLNAETTLKRMVPVEEKTVDEITFKIKKQVVGKTLVKDIEFETDGKCFHFTENVLALTLTDFKQYLEKTGFKIINLFGDYSLNPYNAEQSERLIIVAIKQ